MARNRIGAIPGSRSPLVAPAAALIANCDIQPDDHVVRALTVDMPASHFRGAASCRAARGAGKLRLRLEPWRRRAIRTRRRRRVTRRKTMMNATRGWAPIGVFVFLTGSVGGCKSNNAADLENDLEPLHSELVVAVSDEDYTTPLLTVTGIAAVNDSSIVVGDREYLYHIDGNTGKVDRSFGRSGDGPGEFKRITWLQSMPGDSLAVYDNVLHRITLFGGDLKVVRITTIARAGLGQEVRPQCILSDGSIVELAVDDWRGNRGGMNEGRFQPSLKLRVSNGDSTYNLTQLDDLGRWVVVRTEGYIRSLLNTVIPFSAFPIVRCSAASVLWSDAVRPSVTIATGATATEVPLPGLPAREISPADYSRLVDSVGTAFGPGIREGVENAAANVPLSVMPVMKDVLLSTDHTMWVVHYVRGSDGSKLLAQYTMKGILRRVVAVPIRFTPLAATSTRFWGTWQNEQGIPEVRAYGIPGQ